MIGPAAVGALGYVCSREKNMDLHGSDLLCTVRIPQGTIVIACSYYKKRALRILPAYYSTLAIIHAVLLPSAHQYPRFPEIW